MTIKTVLKLFLILVLPNLALAQSSENSSRVGVYLKSVTHDKKGDMWVGGSVLLLQGLLLRINSSGVTVFTPPNTHTIQDVCFTSAKIGLMIADHRDIHKSFDGGKTWRYVATSADSNLNDITFVGTKFGWTVGDDGVVAHTADGGATWKKQNSGVEVDLKQVVFIDELHGWASGWSMLDLATRTYPSALLATNDGGKTWNKLADEETWSFRKISFVSQLEGWAVELNKDSLMHTVDGGKTWQEQAFPQKYSWSYVYFLNKNQGWVFGDAIASTRNGGKSWKFQKLSTSDFDFDHISFDSESIGGATSWVMGANDKGFDIIRTFNGGKTWQAVSKSWLKKTIDRVYREQYPDLVKEKSGK
jgi:photosystem II stability/assembly factor-like uncharacterized protein